MAITIDTTPATINSAYSAVEWKATSNAPTIVGMRADVVINGTYTTTIEGIQVLGSSSQFSFDIQKIMQDYLTHDLFNVTVTAINQAATSSANVLIKLYEITLDSSGVYITQWISGGGGTPDATSGSISVNNSVIYNDESISNYTIDDATKQLLTNHNNLSKIPRGVSFQVDFLTNDVNIYASIQTKDKIGNILTTITTTKISSFTNNKASINIKGADISNDNIDTLNIHLIKDLVGSRSITYTYKVVDICHDFVLFWQNHLGGFDHFNFDSKLKTNINTSNQIIRKTSGHINLQEKVNEKIKIYAGNLSNADLNKLQDLIINHTLVYRLNGSSFEKYIVVSHSKKIIDNDFFIGSLSLTLEPQFDKIVQKGE